VTAFRDDQVMLTLAGLTYRGFHDPLPGQPHDAIVREALLDGLQALLPVRDDWDLVWGPVTSRGRREIVDSSAMYVVRHAREPQRHVVAIRGTNPVSAPDWLFGDFWVATTVPWPYRPDGAAISASTALGLGTLQAMRARTAPASARSPTAALVGRAVVALTRARNALRAGADAPAAALTTRLTAWLDRLAVGQGEGLGPGGGLKARLARAMATARVLPESLRPRPGSPGPESDLLTFLASQAAALAAPLEVTVTGHSKGGALAQTVALWLREALDEPAERWDAGRGARVSCHAFAGPTPGNAAFADRIDGRLGGEHHHLRNRHDAVTHAWQADELREIPTLYGSRTRLLGPLIASIVADVEPLVYRQAARGMRMFEGALDARRGLALELVHQHLDAYLAELDLHAHDIRAPTFFFY
jgi:hypothetical protein